MPHLSARRIASFADLASFVRRAAEEAGVERCFVIAGDPSTPTGPFADSSSLIETGVFERSDIKVVGVGGLKGMPEALGVVFPATTLQACIVHLIRSSLDYASWKDRKLLTGAIKPIYTAVSTEAAKAELDAFEQGPRSKRFPTAAVAWRRAWDRMIPFFAFPPAVRRVIYMTNAIQGITAQLRKIIRTRGHFPSDDAANKLIWLALRNITAGWGRAAHNWKEAMNQFETLYEEWFTRTVA